MEKQLNIIITIDYEDVAEALKIQKLQPTPKRVQSVLHNRDLAERLVEAVRPYCLQALDVVICDYLDEDLIGVNQRN